MEKKRGLALEVLLLGINATRAGWDFRYFFLFFLSRRLGKEVSEEEGGNWRRKRRRQSTPRTFTEEPSEKKQEQVPCSIRGKCKTNTVSALRKEKEKSLFTRTISRTCNFCPSKTLFDARQGKKNFPSPLLCIS